MTQATTDPRTAVLDRIKELPPLPMVVTQLVTLMQDTECSGEEINRVLSSDQALASKILRLVNSSFYGLPGRVSTIPRAVVILGHAAVRNLATGLAVADSVGRRLPPRQRQLFWRHALATAAGAEVVARRAELPDPEEAFIAGLLHDIGHLILMLALPDGHAAVAADGRLGDVEFERQAIGLDHCRAGRQLLQHWKLPAPLLECVRLHHAPDACLGGATPLLTAVALADRLARVLGAPGEGPAADNDIVALAAALRLTPADVLDLLPAVQERMVEARSFLKVAEIDGAPMTGSGDGEGRPAVVIAGDAERRDWLTALARHHGLQPRDLRDWLVSEPASEPVIVLWDAASIEPAQAARLLPRLLQSGAIIRNIGSQAGGPAAVGAAISLAFSAADLGLANL